MTAALPAPLEAAVEIKGRDDDYDCLLYEIGDRPVVLLGEASHGTHEFYRERARITKRLIDELGFSAVAVEADWPDAYRVNRYVMGGSDDATAVDALSGFRRFPAWMWRNADVAAFVEWLRIRNAAFKSRAYQTRFYGLDLYSMRASMDAVIDYLRTVDPAAAEEAVRRYGCFDDKGEGQNYGYSLAFGGDDPCEADVVAELVDLREKSAELMRSGGLLGEDEFFYAEQNARLVLNAERYYRTMYRRQESSWNIRDQHMHGTLVALRDHLESLHGTSKVVVWEHNSHVGDARATEMSRRGELNVGQLARAEWGDDAYSVGFTTHRGWVTAASDWDRPAERKRVRPALPGSYEEFFHESGPDQFTICLTDEARAALPPTALERAIGVIYRPETERASHWFRADIARQFDAVIHIDSTTAVEPLDLTQQWVEGEPPETYPFGL